VETRGGYRCGWFLKLKSRLVMQPHVLSHCAPEAWRTPAEAEVVGKSGRRNHLPERALGLRSRSNPNNAFRLDRKKFLEVVRRLHRNPTLRPLLATQQAPWQIPQAAYPRTGADPPPAAPKASPAIVQIIPRDTGPGAAATASLAIDRGQAVVRIDVGGGVFSGSPDTPSRGKFPLSGSR